jgi:nucleoside-diphosphate-sugar epimerase
VIGPDILVTGTSGVGRDVVLALLQRTSARVALLTADDTLDLDAKERARVDLLGGDIAAPNLALRADIHGRLTETLETIVHTGGVTTDVLLLAERCFMAGRLQRFIHVNGATEDRMVRAAMNAGLPVTMIGPGMNTMDHVVTAVVRAVNSAARCA